MFSRRLRLLSVALLCLPSLHASAETADPLLQLSVELSSSLPTATPPDATSLALTPPAVDEIRDDLPPLTTIDLVTPPDNLWQRIRNGFGMPNLDSRLVADRQAWYLNRPEMLARIIERSRKYLYHIVDELEQRGMPTELALLPMVESAFNPLAASPARALGMWQFIPSTGKNYKLDRNFWVDERRDIIASTSAALDYLQNIYEMHGDWHLALASYNWGEHAIARAVAKNQAKGLPTDYASLTMPTETRYYVPKLQALKNIIAQPELFGFQLDRVPNQPYFETVDLARDIDISLAAKLAELPLSEFIALNPAHHRPLIRGDQDHQLVLPTEKVQTFLSNLRRHEAQEKPLATWRTHRLKEGEKLDKVASRFNVSVARLKQLNGITNRTKIGPGLNLLVPGPGAQLSDQLAAHLPKVQPETGKRVSGGKSKKSSAGTRTASPIPKANANANAKASGRKPAKKKRG